MEQPPERPRRRIPRPDTGGLHDLRPEATQLPPEATQLPPGYGPWDTGPEEIPLSASNERTLEENDPQHTIDRHLRPAEEALERSQQGLAERVARNERPLVVEKPRRKTSRNQP